MPRTARLDAPGTLHHAIVRGIERRRIFDDDKDRYVFVKTMGQLAATSVTICYKLLPGGKALVEGVSYDVGQWEMIEGDHPKQLNRRYHENYGTHHRNYGSRIGRGGFSYGLSRQDKLCTWRRQIHGLHGGKVRGQAGPDG